MRLRIYHNRWSDWPRIWSYDHGTPDTEINVSGFSVHGGRMVNGEDPTVPSGDRERPRVWLEVLDVERVEVIEEVLHVYGS